MEWSAHDAQQLQLMLAERQPLAQIVHELDLPFADVARQAVSHQPRPAGRARRIPRGKGYNKQTIKEHVIKLWGYQGTIPQYARANSMQPDVFIAAFQQHFPDSWRDYTAQHGLPEQHACQYCESMFYPANGNQFFCTPKCASDQRSDDHYFGGRKRNTIGLAAGVCQCCGQPRAKGLAAHHMLGKENDPDNELLIALCPGCHDLVGTLARRLFVSDPAVWEALISLALIRRGENPTVRVRIEQPVLA